ncbi:MAG: hypothetical protein A3E88_07255 [Legionellales bacterium RIFCSPHIGHO2_12_FULL_35_11]|nr:MAG: hypothetical protein A3E88_07255 [Legionellales bacterium RIFCSPHIGHO2_12_FULL_35_11]
MSIFKISERTQKLFKEKISLQDTTKTSDESDLSKVTAYLKSVITMESVAKLDYIDASLRLAILRDLARHYNIKKNEKEEFSLKSKFLLFFFAFMGIFYNICNGYVGAASILTLFIGMPGWVVILVGVALSIICVAIFLADDLSYIAKNWQIGFYKDSSMLDLLVEQKQILNSLTSKLTRILSSTILNPQKEQDNKEILELYDALNDQDSQLGSIKKLYQEELQTKHRISKIIAATLAGIIYFNYGFFTGQAMAYLICAAIITPTVAIASWPIVLASIIMGFMALALYLATVRVDNLVGVPLGLDPWKIDSLPDETGGDLSLGDDNNWSLDELRSNTSPSNY